MMHEWADTADTPLAMECVGGPNDGDVIPYRGSRLLTDGGNYFADIDGAPCYRFYRTTDDIDADAQRFVERLARLEAKAARARNPEHISGIVARVLAFRAFVDGWLGLTTRRNKEVQ